jgi:predicted acyltransferase
MSTVVWKRAAMLACGLAFVVPLGYMLYRFEVGLTRLLVRPSNPMAARRSQEGRSAVTPMPGAAATPAKTAEDRKRLHALDVARGITIAGMILVSPLANFPATYPQLLHSRWHGLTLAELGFPVFLFIVGITTDFSIASRRARNISDSAIVAHVLKRSVPLFLLGLVGTGFPDYDLAKIRIPGVLQRIAITYFVAALIALRAGTRGRMVAGAALLLGYWLAMTIVPVPATGALGFHVLDRPEATLAAWVDRTLLGDHLWSETRTWDPEGILSTLPAIGSVLFGTIAGAWLRRRIALTDRVVALLAVGVMATALGIVWGWIFPISKVLWTSSYVMATAGIAALGLGTCFWLIDLRRSSWWTPPFVAFGVNPLAAYIGSIAVDGLLGSWLVISEQGSEIPARRAIYDAVFASWLDPRNASLAYGAAYLLLWFPFVWWLYRRGTRVRL